MTNNNKERHTDIARKVHFDNNLQMYMSNSETIRTNHIRFKLIFFVKKKHDVAHLEVIYKIQSNKYNNR